MKFTTLCAYALAFFSTGVHSYPVTSDNLNCRSGPGTAFAIKKSYKKGQDVTITCQTQGDNVEGNSIWDKTSDGCYVADKYVKTGKDGYVKGKCTNVPKPPRIRKSQALGSTTIPTRTAAAQRTNGYTSSANAPASWHGV
ncbi:protein YraJ [Fusarium oxysporum f. sp. conglutinans]|nr:protein YraJ [Fusarium oxysporum f. sp. conglutinans]